MNLIKTIIILTACLSCQFGHCQKPTDAELRQLIGKTEKELHEKFGLPDSSETCLVYLPPGKARPIELAKIEEWYEQEPVRILRYGNAGVYLNIYGKIVGVCHQSLMSIDSPREFAIRISALGNISSEEMLSRLVDTAEPSIALAAEWKRLLIKMASRNDEEKIIILSTGEATKPSEESVVLGEEVTKPFLDLVKQKIGIGPPAQWTQWIQEAKWRAPDRVSFLKERAVIALLESADRPLVTDDDPPLAVQQGDRTWLIPKRLSFPQAVIDIRDKTAYLAIYGTAYSQYYLYAFEEDRMLWSSKIFGNVDRRNMARSGTPSLQFVEMVTTQEQIVLFGVSSGNAYFEAFDAKTGTPICRFATSNVESLPQLITPRSMME